MNGWMDDLITYNIAKYLPRSLSGTAEEEEEEEEGDGDDECQLLYSIYSAALSVVPPGNQHFDSTSLSVLAGMGSSGGASDTRT
jgi:hypothetical protein